MLVMVNVMDLINFQLKIINTYFMARIYHILMLLYYIFYQFYNQRKLYLIINK